VERRPAPLPARCPTHSVPARERVPLHRSVAIVVLLLLLMVVAVVFVVVAIVVVVAVVSPRRQVPLCSGLGLSRSPSAW